MISPPTEAASPETASLPCQDEAPVPETVEAGVDLVEWYYAHGFSDGLPVVPPTVEKVAAMVDALGGDADLVECRVPPRWGNLTRQVLAVNAVMAGCLPGYVPVVRAAMLALTDTT